MTMKIGFAKVDITPRIGVELAGFGPFLLRRAETVLEPLWARAMAVENDDGIVILVSCDIIGVVLSMTCEIREIVHRETHVDPQHVTVFCSHTHSGPNPTAFHGWGETDPSYRQIFPTLVAKACVQALKNREEAELRYAYVPCENIAVNREAEKEKRKMIDISKDSWRPKHPELADTKAHVITAVNKKGLLGFISSFGCHPVTCCERTNAIHGDFYGVATNKIEREYQSAIGLFILGAHGDVDTCAAHLEEKESFEALEFVSERYAKTLRNGIEQAQTIKVDTLRAHTRQIRFKRQKTDLEKLRDTLRRNDEIFNIEADREFLLGPEGRKHALCSMALKKIIKRLENGEQLSDPTELQTIKIGPLRIACSGFETFQAIKNDVLKQTGSEMTIISSLSNDGLGYAVDHEAAQKGGYAASFAPFIFETLPYANIHDELAAALTDILTLIF